MKSLADALPSEIAQQIHPDWRKNESDYWLVRDTLLTQYRGQWIGFADGAVIATGSAPLEVFMAIHGSRNHPFVIRVGHEDEPWYHIRRTAFAYDTTCPPTALPVYPCQVQADFGDRERILGRDVLNRMEILFRGPSGGELPCDQARLLAR